MRKFFCYRCGVPLPDGWTAIYGPCCDEVVAPGVSIERREQQRNEFVPTIGADGRCTCTCADPCPLGGTGMAMRCTRDELLRANVGVVDYLATVPVTECRESAPLDVGNQMLADLEGDAAQEIVRSVYPDARCSCGYRNHFIATGVARADYGMPVGETCGLAWLTAANKCVAEATARVRKRFPSADIHGDGRGVWIEDHFGPVDQAGAAIPYQSSDAAWIETDKAMSHLP